MTNKKTAKEIYGLISSATAVKNNLTHEEKVTYLSLALSLQKIQVEPVVADAMITTYERICEKGAAFSLRDNAQIHSEIVARWESLEKVAVNPEVDKEEPKED